MLGAFARILISNVFEVYLAKLCRDCKGRALVSSQAPTVSKPTLSTVPAFPSPGSPRKLQQYGGCRRYLALYLWACRRDQRHELRPVHLSLSFRVGLLFFGGGQRSTLSLQPPRVFMVIGCTHTYIYIGFSVSEFAGLSLCLYERQGLLQ